MCDATSIVRSGAVEYSQTVVSAGPRWCRPPTPNNSDSACGSTPPDTLRRAWTSGRSIENMSAMGRSLTSARRAEAPEASVRDDVKRDFGSSTHRRMQCGPVEDSLEGFGQGQKGLIGTWRSDELHTDRQELIRPVKGQRKGWLPRQAERG